MVINIAIRKVFISHYLVKILLIVQISSIERTSMQYL